MYICMHVCMYACMYVCMYVCVCIYIYIYIYHVFYFWSFLITCDLCTWPCPWATAPGRDHVNSFQTDSDDVNSSCVLLFLCRILHACLQFFMFFFPSPKEPPPFAKPRFGPNRLWRPGGKTSEGSKGGGLAKGGVLQFPRENTKS